MLFSYLLFFAHLQAILFPFYLGYKSINKFKYFKNPKLFTWGFSFLGLASFFEMIDHTKTEWIYVNHSSIFNSLFYSFLGLGLTFLSISTIRNKSIILINYIICFLGIISYWLFGKTIALIFQILISFILIINWQRKFKDWLFIGYPIFGIFFTTFFGIKLSTTANQIWHIFIGPSGTISVFIFYLVLIRFNKKLSKINDKKFFK